MNLELLEEKLRNIITEDIRIYLSSGILEREDPLGYSIYLFFLTRSGIEGDEVDALIDWMNSWIEDILNRGFSRFIDREFTALVLGYSTLKSINKLQIHVNVIDKIYKEISNLIINDLFFGNLTYSLIILLSLADQVDLIKVFDPVLNRVKRYLERQSLFNDPKNLVFASMLFERLDARAELNTLIDICFERLQRNEIPYSEKIYYAWVLWNYRFIKRSELPTIVEFVESTLKNVTLESFNEKVDNSVKEMYGSDLKPKEFSKIFISVLLDLVVNFKRYRLSARVPDFIERTLEKLGWEDVLLELKNALRAFDENRLGDCCNNLRMGLATLLTKIYESLTGKPAPIKPGKSTDIPEILKVLKMYGLPEDAAATIRLTWSYTSERAHIEKRGGKQPSVEEVRYGIQLTFSAIEFLLHLFFK